MAWKTVGSKKKIELAHATDNAAPFSGHHPFHARQSVKDLGEGQYLFTWPVETRYGKLNMKPDLSNSFYEPGKHRFTSKVPERDIIYRNETGGFFDKPKDEKYVPEAITHISNFRRGMGK